MQTALLVACGLLLIGFTLRARIKILQWLYIPASVAGGLIGLILASANLFSEESVDRLPSLVSWFVVAATKLISQDTVIELKSWPGWLISIVFAGLLLERSDKSFRESLFGVTRQGIFVWIITLGQVAIGVFAIWIAFPLDSEVPGSFGQLIEVGFAGGHGTAAAMGVIYKENLDFPDGPDLAFFFATAGLLYGVVSGMVYVNLAVRRGWTRVGDVKIPVLTGLEARDELSPIGFGRVRAEVLDPLVFQALIVATALGVGIGLQKGVMLLVAMIGNSIGLSAEVLDQTVRFAGNLPLFMFALIGGLIVRELMYWLRVGDLIDGDSIRRISGFAMEFLIVAAVTSINLSVLEKFGWPILMLLILAFAWTGFCLMVIAPRLLPHTYWFELGILNYGMSTATTAQGLMLLRIIDKDLESKAAEDYALAAPLSAPFVGGGVVTLLFMPWLLENANEGFVAIGLMIVVAALYGIGTRMAVKNRE